MKVKELFGFSGLMGGDPSFVAYYHTKIEDRNIILGRDIHYYITSRKRNSMGNGRGSYNGDIGFTVMMKNYLNKRFKKFLNGTMMKIIDVMPLK